MGKELQWGYKAIEEITITSETEEGRLILKVLDQKNKEIKKFEAETTQLKERVAELEAENELCEKVHLMVHNENQTNLNRIAELKAELKRKDEEESDLLAIAYLQGAGKTNRLKRFARKIYDELQELKSGVIAEFEGTGVNKEIYFTDHEQNEHEIITEHDTDGKHFKIIIKEKKQ